MTTAAKTREAAKVDEVGPSKDATVPDHPLLEGLNDEQRAAVTHDAGPLLIVAGAGTGKTTVISRRIGWLIATGRAKPEEILALTFTEKAAGEMVERVDQLLPLGYADLHISTFHAFCRRLLEERGLDIGVPHEFRLLDQTDAYLLVRRNLDRFNLNYYKPLGNPTKFLHAMLKHFSRAKDEDISPEEYLKYGQALTIDVDLPAGQTDATPEHAPTSGKTNGDDGGGYAMGETMRQRELAEAYHTYQRLLAEEGCLDLGDLQMYAIRLLRTRPQVLALYRQRYKYVLVDEFQDTNWAQYALIKMLVGGGKGAVANAGGGNLVVVGDDDQSIYKFRGASVSNILQFKEDFVGAADLVLATNYRSRQGILDLAYGFIQRNNPNRLEAKLGVIKRLTGTRPGDAIVEHLRFGTHEDEVSGVVDRIVAMKNELTEREWSDFCILVRSNSGADDYSREFQKRGVPYQFLALRGLYAKPVIMDVLAYFQLLIDYHESPALYRILSSRPYAVPVADLIQLSHEAHKSANSLYEVLQRKDALPASSEGVPRISEAARAQIDRLLGHLARHTQLARTKSVAQVLIAFLIDSGYMRQLKSDEDGRAREQFGYLHQFLDRIKRFDEAHDDPTLKRFMEEFELERESGEEGSLAFDPDVGPDMVRIMTVHASKGLEFPFVFIVDMVDKRFPTIARGGDIPLPDALTKEILPEGSDVHLEEERRLFYVAATRAKDGLFLTSAEDYGGKTKKKPSLFLAELGLDATPNLAPGPGRLSEPAPVPAPTSTVDLPIPTHFSFSQVAAYDTCPLQYKYAHIIKIPSLGKPQRSFGNTIHATLEWFLNTVSERDAAPSTTLSTPTLSVSLPEMLAKYAEVWQDDWYEDKESKERYRAEGRDMLVKFFNDCTAVKPTPLFLEKEFTLKFGEHAMKGKIDRIDTTDGGVDIIDYKTGEPKTDDDIDFKAKRQLLLYQIAVSRLFGLVPVRLTFQYLKDGSKVQFLGSEKQLGKIEAEVEETFAKIRGGNFDPTPGRHCRHCDFKDICEFRE